MQVFSLLDFDFGVSMFEFFQEVGGEHVNLRHMLGMLKGSDAEVFVHDGENILSSKRFGQVVTGS
jgi:hypothetical protein